jgi:16S rRNA (uracil1498-N3)-methyltransferase
MKLHRFYSGDLHDKFGPLELRQHVWVNDHALVQQWSKVLRYGVGDQLVLFNGQGEDRLYKINKIEPTSFGLELVTQLEPVTPKNEVYLFFSMLKKDKNEWVLQKCTELGVSHFVPLLSARTEKTGFDEERAKKIIIEAAEQCGRSDIPKVREPVTLETALQEYASKLTLFYAEQHTTAEQARQTTETSAYGVCIGPEGGWTEEEKQLLQASCIGLNISKFTLRAETACVVAASVMQTIKNN